MQRWKKVASIAAALTLTAVGGAGVAWAQAGPDDSGAAGIVGPAETASRALGNGVSEAKFIPITPCRLADTRVALGPITNGTTRDYDVRGTGSTFAAQGGKAGGCGIPAASAVEVTVTAVEASSEGFLRVFPGAEPQATFLNYPTGFNPSNTGTVALCSGICLVNRDLRIKNYGGPTHIVIDVQGYYVAPLAATVNSDGSLARNSRTVASTRNSVGNYRVTFDRNVRACVFTASIGYPAPAGTLNGEIQVQYNALDPNAAFVATSNSAGVLEDLPFNIEVTC